MIGIRWIVRLVGLTLLGLGVVGCIQQTSPGLEVDEQGKAPASTQLAVQATRIAALETDSANLAAELTRQAGFISYLATRMPPMVPTLQLGPATPFSEFQGGVSIEGGRCCAGGVAGQELLLSVDFNAYSPYGAVTEMRVATGLAGLSDDAIDLAAWEPFAPTRQFSVTLPINWIGFELAVQFRDALGNLSRVFRAEISIEGMPATPSVIPAP